jgi:hypothetical protein
MRRRVVLCDGAGVEVDVIVPLICSLSGTVSAVLDRYG